jgi:hypothetical protein
MVFNDKFNIDCVFCSAQFFKGLNKFISDKYGVNTDSDIVDQITKNIGEWGAMDKLICDRSKVKINSYSQGDLRSSVTLESKSEPYHQNQHFAQNQYITNKSLKNWMLNCSSVPLLTWLLAMSYACCILSYLASISLW